MARKNSIILVNAKLYRHFAVVTVVLTGAMAILADGEKRQAVAQGIEEARTYEPKPSIKPQLIIKNADMASGSGSGGGFYDEVNDSNTKIYSGYNPASLSLADTGFKVTPKLLAQLGLTLEEFNALTPEEREQIMLKLNNGVTATERLRGIEKTASESLIRSGGSESADY